MFGGKKETKKLSTTYKKKGETHLCSSEKKKHL